MNLPLSRPDLSAPVTEPDDPAEPAEPDTEPDTEPERPETDPVPTPVPAGEPWPPPDRLGARHPRPALPEAAPDLDTWAALLWPWLTEAQRCGRPAAALARILAGRVDARDLTVSTEHRCRCVAVPYGATLAHLVEAGLLVPANPGRHRIVLPAMGDADD